MRYAIPLAAILMVGIAAGIRPPRSGATGPDRRLPPPAPPAVPSSEPLGIRSRAAATAQEAVGIPGPNVKSAEAVPAFRQAGNVPWRKMSVQLIRDLALTPAQKGSVEYVLEERQEEIRRCHQEIRRAQLLDVHHYEWQVGRMKESWYRRIDGLLDGGQHDRFVALVENGLFNEGLGITADPGMTVLD